MSKPDYIPDMSLGDREDKPPRVVAVPPTTDATSSYQPNELTSPAPTPTKRPTSPRDWQEGDRVLAPWEPMFLYAGTIKRFKLDEARGDQVLIEFDYGNPGWVQVYSLCPIELIAGQQVFCRRNRGPHFQPAEILDITGEEVYLRFQDGTKQQTTIAALRIPCIENGPGAVPLGSNGNQYPEPQSTSSGIPSWVWTVGLIILVTFLRAGCRAMGN